MAQVFTLTMLALTMLSDAPVSADEDVPIAPGAAIISPAQKNQDGFLVHTVESRYQSASTEIRVLAPRRLEPGRRYRVLYVLPVEAGAGRQYGDGLLEAAKHDLADKHELICVYPTFSDLPWYADHPTNPAIRQESYLVNEVVPFIERTYPALAERRGRLLVGFSKSGWGAWSLLMRRPDVFGKAAAWDAPLAMDAPGEFGNGPIFGTQENFDRYRISTLLEQTAGQLGNPPRLALLGYGNFRRHHEKIHDIMVTLKISHEYRDGPKRQHAWDSGWLPEAVGFLAGSPAAFQTNVKQHDAP